MTRQADAQLPSDFWGDPREIEALSVPVRPPARPMATLEKLGPSPFERGGFPLVGFLATTFEKVSQFALERSGYHSQYASQPQSSPDIP